MKFGFQFFSHIIVDSEINPLNQTAAHHVFGNAASIMLVCCVVQLILFCVSSSISGADMAISYYHDKERHQIDGLKRRIEMAEKLNQASTQISAIQEDIQLLRSHVHYLNNDLQTLRTSFAVARKEISSNIKQSQKHNNKGDF